MSNAIPNGLPVDGPGGADAVRELAERAAEIRRTGRIESYLDEVVAIMAREEFYARMHAHLTSSPDVRAAARKALEQAVEEAPKAAAEAATEGRHRHESGSCPGLAACAFVLAGTQRYLRLELGEALAALPDPDEDMEKLATLLADNFYIREIKAEREQFPDQLLEVFIG